MRSRAVAPSLALVLVLVAISCDSPDPMTARDDDVIQVASFDFVESELIADLYVEALRSAGFEVRHLRRAGTREVVLPALELGLIDVVPEYAGSAVGFLGGEPSTDPSSTHETLRAMLASRGIDVLAPASAQSRNGLVVTSERAEALGLRTISDLRGLADEMTLGGPPECPDRALCIPGLSKRYGIEFGSFLPLDAGGPITSEAIRRGTVDVGVLFTSDGDLAQRGLTLLRDDRRLQPAENVTPIVRMDAEERFGVEMTGALDAVSARLTTAALRHLNSLMRDGLTTREAASEWLRRQGLSEPSE
jgi:osmoprotectant transport system substrate-binding protein